jgi:hypothetical protein
MSDTPTKARFPNLGKLSIALLEHAVKPVIGEKAIDEIKSPVVEKDLQNSLETALEKAEKRFIIEHTDKAICEAVLNLPLSNLPIVTQTVRAFYSRPNNSTLGQVLGDQLKASFPNISSERIDSGVSAYIRFLRDELANLSDDVRDKLGIHATLEIQDNTARMANTLERVLGHLETKDSTQPRQESQRQISKIVTFARAFGLPSFSSEEQAQEALREFVRSIHSLLGYAFLDTCEVTSVHDFVYLLSLNVATEKDGSITLQLGLVCHITPFVSAFDELITTLFDKSDQEYLDRTNIYPSDLNIKFSYKWETNIPYRITRVGPKAIRITGLDSNFVTVKFPLRTSDLLVVLSAMINGKSVLYDDIDFSSLRPNEIEFIKYTGEAKKHGLDLSDFSIDVSEPESWNITTKGIQRNRR